MGAFDSIALLAGSTGITFTLAILQDLADRAFSGTRLPVRRIRFAWCVKATSWTSWCNNEISSAVGMLQNAGVDVEVSVYVTCADAFTEQGSERKECGCACDKSLGPCCCVLVDEEDEAVQDEETSVKQVTMTEPGDAKVKVIEKPPVRPAVVPPSSITENTALRLPILPCAAFYSGRPDIRKTLTDLLDGADGESGVAVCGPIGMSSKVRNTIVRLSDERAIHKGSGAQGCYLHVESFS